MFSSLALLLLSVALAAQQPATLRGRVTDSAGQPIANARVQSDSGVIVFTNERGEFALPNSSATSEISVKAQGYAGAQQKVRQGEREVTVRLPVARRAEQITVTATRLGTEEQATPAVRVIPREAVLDGGALTLDGVLRQNPAFMLFRRTPGWAANPTAQGVSLRGVGASGASRALVLADGVPLNDPFGGWVYWGQIPRTGIERVEIAEAAESDLYGSDALGGVVQVLREPTNVAHATVEVSGGNLSTPLGSASGSLVFGPWGVSASAQGFQTDGYTPVRPQDRGAVDTKVNSKGAAAEAAVERRFGERGRLYLRGSYYGENRQNGTYLQTNSANLRDLMLGADWTPRGKGTFTLRAFGGTENLAQSFSAIAPDRTTESLTRLQTVPVQQWGASAQWAGGNGPYTLVAGVDTRHVDGESDETGFALSLATALFRSGGVQNTIGGFGRLTWRPHPRLSVAIGARVDRWTNTDGHSISVPLIAGGFAKNDQFPDRSETAFSPRVGAQLRLTNRVSVFGSAARAFRAPTLNELYRGFRLGNILTQANPALTAEHANAFESGVQLQAWKASQLQASWFLNDISDPVANVTLSVTPDLVARQRQNLGSIRSQGVALRWDASITRFVSFTAGYQFALSTVTSFSANPVLEGLWVPQVPRHTGTAQLRYARGSFTGALQGRYQGRQFDDDLNRLPLGGFFTMDAFASQQLGRGVSMIAAAENVFNRRYEVGRTPVLTVGPPIVARVGLRWTLGAH